jgi:hypothetical protein
MESAILHGGLFAIAMPRGSGKTSLAEVAAVWALITGRHKFVMLIAVSATKAIQLLESIKTELWANDLLHADWPEITHPIRALENRANRSKGQHVGGRPTNIGWKQTEIILPDVEGSQAANGILRVAGLTSGSIRGPKFTRPADGKTVRPSLVIVDDPQDDESAASRNQCEKRHRLLHAAIGGMAGPKDRITAICPCTIICPDDLAACLLDRGKSPLWTGQRYQLLARMPERMDLWDEYGARRAEEIRHDGDGSLATAWYGQRKELMDRGAIVSWPERHKLEDLSALQYAMNLYYLDKVSFMSEYQNDPLPLLEETQKLTPDQIAAKVNRQARYFSPIGCTIVTAFIDVQGALLYYLVAGWEDNFTGYILDYGTWPDQERAYFSLASANRTLAKATGHSSREGNIYAGLEKLAAEIVAKNWPREDNSILRVERCLIDAGWGQVRDVIYRYCAQSAFPLVVLPSHGRFVGASSMPMAEYAKKPGERVGTNWILRTEAGRKHVTFDTNYWKSFVHDRLATPMGAVGCLSLFGEKPAEHRLLADHLTSENKIKVEAKGRTVEEWKIRPDRPDNHWFDCLVGCAVGASMLGASMLGSATAGKGGRVSFRELQRKAKERRTRFNPAE